ncbi:hypothetical protein KOW79_013665 [Hemibagrus wyckioides]|uniref:Uncharacterized protein n=1 Tax=Hemibagrus wyckioides TaxID=337641 RepID=A0A9D3NIE2_9TELE|nr:hypothetical protein KOW79_013665 [Hemibagrus wyckioides]
MRQEKRREQRKEDEIRQEERNGDIRRRQEDTRRNGRQQDEMAGDEPRGVICYRACQCKRHPRCGFSLRSQICSSTKYRYHCKGMKHPSPNPHQTLQEEGGKLQGSLAAMR